MTYRAPQQLRTGMQPRDDAPTPRRVYIVGGTGSGKSTLAARLAPRLGLNPINLDDYRYTAQGTRTDRAALTALAAELASRDTWVADGIYLTWTLPLIEAADLIVWLDPPRIVAAWRVLRRWIGLQLRGHAPYGWRKALRITLGAMRPRPLAEVLASPKNLNPSQAAIAAVLQPYEAKTLRAWRRRDLRALVHLPVSEVK